MLESIIAYHCGPALAGIKPANIAACSKKRMPNVHKEIEALNAQLNTRDIYLEIVCECSKRALVMVYRKKVLSKHLQSPEMREFLALHGYPDSASVEEYISVLKQRLCQNDFPHEIGVFLGYPLHDIYGYINHRNDGCLLVGDWKVYANPEEAQKTFARYKACRMAIVRRLTNGASLARIFCAA